MVRRCSWLVVVSVCVALGTAAAAPSVGVDLSKLDCDPASDAAALEQALVIRLLQDGFTIDPLSSMPTIIIAIAGADHELVLSAKSAFFEETRTIDTSGSSGAQLHLELVQKAVELARLAREAMPTLPPPLAPAQPVDAAVVVRAPSPPARPPRWQLGADVGVISSRELETALHARLTIASGFGVALRTSAVNRDTAAIEVGEQDLLAGASYARPLTTLLALDVAVLAGVRRHHFELAMPLENRTGTRFDGSVAVPLRISIQPWRMVELSVWGIAKLASARDHASGTTVLWHRDGFGAGVGAGVAARF